jgi:hypothetical protein
VDLARLGGFLIALGAIGFVRLLPEMVVALKDSWKAVYWLIAGIDVVISILSILAGRGLRKRSAWAPKVTSWVAGLMLTTSVGLGWLILDEVLKHLRWNRSLDLSDAALIPRLLFYLIALAFWPYGLRVMFRGVPSDSRKSTWVSLASSTFIGAIVTGLIYLSTRH